MRFTLLGVGAMNSPRYRPAGLLLACGRARVVFDGGPGAEPAGRLDAWLVTDERSELRAPLRRLARGRGQDLAIASFTRGRLRVDPRPVVHTSHPTVGYIITDGASRAMWAPEFLAFPEWAAGADLLFAEAAGWSRPIRFARGTGGHAAAVDVARNARDRGVERLVFAHIGRPTIGPSTGAAARRSASSAPTGTVTASNARPGWPHRPLSQPWATCSRVRPGRADAGSVRRGPRPVSAA
jgi:hypothetical protein